MGVVGRYPFAVAAGLGLNGVVAFQLAAVMSWPAAMGIVVLEGLVITALVLTGLRQRIFDAIPLALKQSISVGIGLFIAFIGFVDAGFVRRSGAGSVVKVGVLSTVLFVFTLMLADFFDTMGTVVGVGNEGELLDERGRLPGVG